MTPWAAAMAGWQSYLAVLRLQQDFASVAFGAPMVIASRFAKAGRDWQKPGFAFDPEWQRMVSEKIKAAGVAQGVLNRYWMDAAGKPFDAAKALSTGKRGLAPYGRAVRGNVRRLGR